MFISTVSWLLLDAYRRGRIAGAIHGGHVESGAFHAVEGVMRIMGW